MAVLNTVLIGNIIGSFPAGTAGSVTASFRPVDGTTTLSADNYGSRGGNSPTGFDFSADGLWLFWQSATSAAPYYYKTQLIEPFNLASAQTPPAQGNSAFGGLYRYGIAVSSDGTRILKTRYSPDDRLEQFNLPSAYDISSLSATPSATFVLPTGVKGMDTSPDGSRVYVVQTPNDGTGTIYGYTLSTPWSVSSASQTSTLAVTGSNGTSPTCVAVSEDGLHLYVGFDYNSTIVGSTVQQYDMSTAWNLSTATFVGESPNFYTVGNGTNNRSSGLRVSASGTDLWICGGEIIRHTMSTPHDITTLSYTPPSSALNSRFQSADTLDCRFPAGVNDSGFVFHDDTFGLGIRIMNGSTVLAAGTAGGAVLQMYTRGTEPDGTPIQKPFPYLNTTATKAQWDGATVELHQSYSAVMGNDSVTMPIPRIVVVGTYTQSPPPTVTATASSTLPKIGQAATADFGVPTVYGIGSEVVTVTVGSLPVVIHSILKPVKSNATATVSDPVYTGSAASQLRGVETYASATSTRPVFTGAASSTLKPVSQSAAAQISDPVYTGGIASVLPLVSQSAVAVAADPVFSGVAVSVLSAVTQSAAASGAAITTGAATSILKPVSQAATGTASDPVYTATATSVLKPVIQSASSIVLDPVDTGAAISILKPVTQSASATTVRPVYTGTSTSTLRAVTTSAVAAAQVPVYTAVAVSILARTTSTGSAYARVWQYLRPNGDSIIEGWTDQLGGTVDIFNAINESTADDSDYIEAGVL